MNVHILNPLDMPDWDEKILRLPGHSFFHSSAWARVLSESYGYKPLYFTTFDGDAISACLPMMEIKSFLTGKRGVSLPFTDFCEPLAGDTTRFQELFDEAAEYGRTHGWKTLELRGGSQFLDSTPPSSTYLAHILDLRGCSQDVSLSPQSSVPSPVRFQRSASTPCPLRHALHSTFRDSTRRNIKKALKEAVEVRILTSLNAVQEFYRLNCMTRKEHGLPPQPYSFFRKVHEHILSKDLGFVALAYCNDEAIAGNVYFHFDEAAIYKYGASDKAHQDRRASNLVMWEAIRWLCQRGFKELHMGRTEHDHRGLRQFKTGWGTTESRLSCYRYNLRTSAFRSNGTGKTTGIANKALTHTPLPVLRIMGSLLYKHVG